jgi:hypothetical protein
MALQILGQVSGGRRVAKHNRKSLRMTATSLHANSGTTRGCFGLSNRRVLARRSRCTAEISNFIKSDPLQNSGQNGSGPKFNDRGQGYIIEAARAIHWIAAAIIAIPFVINIECLARVALLILHIVSSGCL